MAFLTVALHLLSVTLHLLSATSTLLSVTLALLSTTLALLSTTLALLSTISILLSVALALLSATSTLLSVAYAFIRRLGSSIRRFASSIRLCATSNPRFRFSGQDAFSFQKPSTDRLQRILGLYVEQKKADYFIQSSLLNFSLFIQFKSNVAYTDFRVHLKHYIRIFICFIDINAIPF